MVRLSIAIPQHPSRTEMVREMMKQLDLDDRKMSVLVDHDLQGVWANSRLAWLDRDLDATHHLVMEDDVLPCRDLLAGIEQAVSFLPNKKLITSFFTEEPWIYKAMSRGYIWAEAPWTTAQALVLPVELVDEWIEWTDRWMGHIASIAADHRLVCWAITHNVDIWHSCPSLVEHLGAGTTTTTETGKPDFKTPGYSAKFIGEHKSALDIDWNWKTSTGKPASYRLDPKRIQHVNATLERIGYQH